MKRLAGRAVLPVLMTGFAAGLAFLALFLGSGWGPTVQANPGVVIGIDADPTGNTATSLGTIDDCRSTVTGQTVQVDLYITDVVELLSFSSWLFYDGDVVHITAIDVNQFLAAGDGSQVWNASHTTFPDSDGLYLAGAADIGTDQDSGSGVLARITLQGAGTGISPIWLSKAPEDVVLRNHNGQLISASHDPGRIGVNQTDSDGDTIADMCDPDVDSDGDLTPNPADLDDDNDTFSDEKEAFIGTDPLDRCPNVTGTPGLCPGPSCDGHDAWPPDNNVDRSVSILDVLNFKPHLVSQFMDPRYDRRFDLNADQIINIIDVLVLKPTIGTTCTNP
jgi:hypothetical protein